MKKLFLLLLLPMTAYADRLGSLRSDADVLLTTQAVAGSGNPGGSTGQLQYNNSGSFAGVTNSTVATNGGVTLSSATVTGTLTAGTLRSTNLTSVNGIIYADSSLNLVNAFSYADYQSGVGPFAGAYAGFYTDAVFADQYGFAAHLTDGFGGAVNLAAIYASAEAGITNYSLYADHGSIYYGDVGANKLLATDANSVIVSTTINLGASNVGGTLAAGRFPALTGDITTSAGSVATTAAATQANIATLSRSAGVSVTGSGGLSVTYGVTGGSVTVNDLTASRPVLTDSNKKLVSGQIDLANTNHVTGVLPSANITVSTRSFVWDATALQALETNFAPITSTGTVLTLYQVRAFDDTTREYVNGWFKVPSNIASAGDITIRLDGRAATAASANTAWTLEHLPLADSEAMSGTYLVSNSGDLASDATQGDINQDSWTMSISSSTWAANDSVFFRLSRNPSAGSDLTGDYYLKGLTIFTPTAQ